MTRSDDALKGCPFCRSKDAELRPVLTITREGPVVICTACSALGPTRRSEAEAIIAWNTRSASAPVIDDGVVDALRMIAGPLVGTDREDECHTLMDAADRIEGDGLRIAAREAEIEAMADRIAALEAGYAGLVAVREAHWAKWPQGDAGDAIDFACDHVSPMPKMRWFLEDWRSGQANEWPDYMRWLNVQRDGARTALRGNQPEQSEHEAVGD